MIVANIATYPPRRESLVPVLTQLSGQVDQINLVMNEYSEIPAEVSAFSNVNAVIPHEDTKDVGKFYVDVSGADYVFLIDDDIVYPSDFIAKSIERFEALGGAFIASYHGSLYVKAKLNRRKFGLRPKRLVPFVSGLIDDVDGILRYAQRPADFRKVFSFFKELESAVVVDQIATCAAILRGADMPSYDYMRTSQKFVDVRLAKWAFEQGLSSAVLPKDADWLKPIRYDETIWQDFTQKNPKHVSAEIMTYVFKSPNLGTEITSSSR